MQSILPWVIGLARLGSWGKEGGCRRAVAVNGVGVGVGVAVNGVWGSNWGAVAVHLPLHPLAVRDFHFFCVAVSANCLIHSLLNLLELVLANLLLEKKKGQNKSHHSLFY